MADVILHNRPEGTPSDNEFVAYGTPTTPSGQIKMSNFYTLLMSKLGFFKVSNLFSEIFGNVTSMASARANLSVPSVDEMQAADNLKANKSNVIEKDSTVAFTPTIGTHPVNKKYVDNKIQAGKKEVIGIQAGTHTHRVTLPVAMADINYVVVATIANGDVFQSVQDVRVMPIVSTTYFYLILNNNAGDILGTIFINWVAVKL